MSAVIRSAAVGAGSTGRPASTAEVADRWSRLVDHSWLLLDGVLFCVAGSRHTDRQVTGCAYWISTRRAEELHYQLDLPRRRPAPGAPLPALLHYAGTTYVKLPTLAPPPAWPAVHAALADAGVRPVESSLLATAELAAARGMLDPRDAVQAAAALPGHSHRCGLAVLHTLLAAIGDPAGTAGSIGLTGRAAFDPARLCGGVDVDLLIYAPVDRAAALAPEVLVHAGIRELGGVHLADLPADDPRWAAYGWSRLFPAGRAGPHRDRLWSRRRDVAWVGDVRLDLTVAPPTAQLVAELPYAAPPVGPVAGLLQLTGVAPGYPVCLAAAAGDGGPVQVWVTARGFDGALQPDDRVRLAGIARQTARGPVVTVDDVPSHHLQLEA